MSDQDNAAPTCVNCGRDLAPTGDGYTHILETFSLPCAEPSPAKADDLVGFLRARLVEQLRNGNFLGADLDATPTRRATGVELIKDAVAKLEIIDEHAPRQRQDGALECPTCVYTGDDTDPAGNRFRYREHEDFPCLALRVLALPYASHKDYREEWRP